jgi:hypothetical protein
LERFNLKKLKEQYRYEKLDTEVDVNNAWETIRENINISAKESLGYYELKKNKPWFDEGCSKYIEN